MFAICNKGIYDEGLKGVEKVFVTSLRNDIPSKPFGNNADFWINAGGSVSPSVEISGKSSDLVVRKVDNLSRLKRNTWSPSLGRFKMSQRWRERSRRGFPRGGTGD